MFKFLKKHIGSLAAQIAMFLWYFMLLTLVFYCWDAEMAQFRYMQW